MFAQGDRRGSLAARRRRTSTSSARRIEPLASAGKLGALLAQFPASFKNEPDSRGVPRVAARASRLPGRRGAAPSELERSARRDAAAARRLRRALGADRRAEVPALDPPEPAAERADVLLPAPARPERRAVVEPRKSEDRYNYLYSAEELQPFAEAAKEASREVKKRTSMPTITSRRSRSPTPRS